MRKKNATTFAFLLDYLKVSSVKISGFLQLERSSISKWKSGARELGENNPYLEKIADYLVSYDRELVKPKLATLFNKVYNKSIDNSPSKIKAHIIKFLLSKNIPMTALNIANDKGFLYKSEFLVYRGKEGRKSSLNFLLNFMDELTQPTTLYLLDSNRFIWLSSDVNYAFAFYKRIKELSEFGHTIILIYYADLAYENIHYKTVETFAYRKNLHECFIKNDYANTMLNTLYLIKGKMSIVGFDASHNTDDMFTSIYTDQFTVMQHLRVLEYFHSVSEPVYDDFFIKNTDNLFSFLSKYENSYDQAYYLDNQLSLSTMPTALLEEILDCNHVSTKQKELCLQVHQVFMRSIGINCPKQESLQLYFIKDLERELKKDQFINHKLSLIAKKKIYITKDQLKRHFKSFSEVLQTNPNVKVALVEVERMNKNEYISLFKKEDFIAIIDYKTGVVKISRIKFMTTLAYHAFENFLETLPLENKDSVYVTNRFLNYSK